LRWCLFGLLALAAACGGEPRTRRVTPEITSGAACVAALASQGISTAPWSTTDGCRVDMPVIAVAGRSRLDPAPKTSCALLLAWTEFEGEIDRLARDIAGSGLRSVENFGSFACRRMTGNAGRRSLHASGLALDVSGLTLTDGTVISVERHWRVRDRRGRLLRAVAEAGCRHFSAVLTPRTDRFHQDHLHFDLGPWRICDA
jgi:hypothetical protein